MLKRLIANQDKNLISKLSRLLILISGSLSAGESVLLLMIIARTNSLEDTGILTIAFAISKLLLNIGKYGVRNYQVTDSSSTSFDDWLCTRKITITIMMVVSAGYVLYQTIFNDYTSYKSIIVLLMCFLYAIESYEDVYTGYYQHMGRLDVSSLIQIYRTLAMMVPFAIVLIVFHNLMLAVICSVVVSILVVGYATLVSIPSFRQAKAKPQKDSIIRILKDCLPLCVTSFLLIYISNGPKYAIDSFYDSETQAYYGFVAMPVFIISLFSGFLLQPQLKRMAEHWHNLELSKFGSIIKRQLLYITGISIVSLLGGWIAGIPLLSILYNVDGLEEYKMTFLMLLVGGCGLAVINFFTAVLTTLRRQKEIIIVYAIVGLGILLTLNLAIKKYAVIGVTIASTIWIFILAIMLFFVYLYSVKNAKTTALVGKR